MKCAYVHVDIIDHALHKGFESTSRDYCSSKRCTHTPRSGKNAVKIGKWHMVRSTQTEMKTKGHFAYQNLDFKKTQKQDCFAKKIQIS